MPADDRRDRMSARRPAYSDDRMSVRAEPSTPIHRGGELDFTENPGRDYWWDQLDPNARRNMLDRAAEVIEWWAYVYDEGAGRPYAVVLGRRALVMSRPDLNAQGRPTDRLLAWSLREASHRSVQVSGASGGDSPAGAARVGRRGSGGDRQARPPVPATVNLPEHIRGFLGNLPAEAQRRMQVPFVGGDLVQESDHHFYGYPERLDVWCCLAGSRTVTFVSGTGLLIPGRGRAYSWELTCRRAEVAGS